MNIEFKTSRTAKLFSSEKAMKAEWGAAMAQKIKMRLQDLEAASTLEEVRFLPGRCHELTGNRAGQLAMDLIHPYRLVFVPNHDPVPLKLDNGLDWKKVTSVLIVEVCDYH